jgi:hypothetical protein
MIEIEELKKMIEIEIEELKKMTKKKIETKAPKKLSEAVAMALVDMAKVEKSAKMCIDMSEWHRPANKTYQTKCSVCMAGAVMHYRGKLSVEENVAGVEQFSAPWCRVFEALDEFREGLIDDSLITMGVSDKKAYETQQKFYEESDVPNVEYEHDSLGFRKWAKEVVKFLRKRNL